MKFHRSYNRNHWFALGVSHAFEALVILLSGGRLYSTFFDNVLRKRILGRRDEEN